VTRVGVIVPVHGFAPYLAEALDAVLAEAPDAVVVVDDGSPAPLALHPDHAPRCTLVRRELRAGPAAARDRGLAALTDDVGLVALCDADDAWTAGSLAPRVAALEVETAAVGCFGRALVVGPDGRETGERWAAPAAGRHEGPGWLYAHNPIPTSSVVLRASALDAAGGFASALPLAEDWDLWLRLAALGPWLCVPDAVVRYRRHPLGLTADVAALARAQLALHAAHAGAVGRTAALRARWADRLALTRARR
jgi:glycosyltransferase involved in cell wall biosynthesis